MIVTVHQPNLFPRLKVLQKLAISEKWIVLDNVQFNGRDYQNRAMIVPDHGPGGPFWLTLSVRRHSGRATLIRDISLVEGAFERFHRSLLFLFRRGESYEALCNELASELMKLRSKPNLTDIAVASTVALLKMSGYVPEILYASQLIPSRDVTDPSLRVAMLCQEVGASMYLADSGSVDYLDERPLQAANIGVLWQVWRPPGTVVDPKIHATIRNGSSLNFYVRAPGEFRAEVRTAVVSRFRHSALDKSL